MILILGGTGAYFLDLDAALGPCERREIDTPYGAAGAILLPQRYGGRIGFTSRHGWGRLEVTPPFVNSRANLWAARELGATHILSWNGVGAIDPLLQTHDLLVLDGVLDFTKTRRRSFNDEPAETQRRRILSPTPESPFDDATRDLLYTTAAEQQARVFAHGVYACSEGPRLETAAEIAALGRFGAEVVGMTLIPEVFLAQELGLRFAALAYVTNYATGVEPIAGAPRFFGVEVAQRCLAIMVAAAERLAGKNKEQRTEGTEEQRTKNRGDGRTKEQRNKGTREQSEEPGTECRTGAQRTREPGALRANKEPGDGQPEGVT
jgi:5'-methylthioadenosine phosphorylase